MLPEKLDGATEVEVDEDQAQDRKMRRVLKGEVNLVDNAVGEQKKRTNTTPPPDAISQSPQNSSVKKYPRIEARRSENTGGSERTEDQSETCLDARGHPSASDMLFWEPQRPKLRFR